MVKAICVAKEEYFKKEGLIAVTLKKEQSQFQVHQG